MSSKHLGFEVHHSLSFQSNHWGVANLSPPPFTLMPLFKYSANHFQFSSSSLSETEAEAEGDGDKCRKSHFPSKAEGGTI